MSERRVLIIHSEKEDFSKKEIRWREYCFRFSPFGFEDFVNYTGVSDEEFQVYYSLVDRVNDLIDAGADIVWSESPEALIVQQRRRAQGRPRVPFVIHEQDRMKRLKRVARWLRNRDGADPLPGFVSCESNFWIHMTKTQRDFYIGNGIPGDRLYYFACSTAELQFVSPEVYKAVRGAGVDEKEECRIAREVRGKPLAAGSNLRDYETLAAAAGKAGCEIHVICDLKRYPPRGPSNLVWHDFVPIAEYIQALKAASMILVPLKETDISGGENTTTFAWAFGKPVIVTRVEATEDFVSDGEDAVMVAPGDADALADAIKRLAADPAEAAMLGENGRRKDAELSAVCERNIAEAFDRAFSLTIGK